MAWVTEMSQLESAVPGVAEQAVETRASQRRTSPSAATLYPPGVASRTIDGVIVLAVDGPLNHVVDELTVAVRYALAEGPRALVCDLSGVTHGVDVDGLDLLAASTREVRDWPGTPIVMTSPDGGIRAVLRLHSMSDHVMVRSTLGRALADVEKCPAPVDAHTRLEPRTTASRSARNFVSRTCLDWGLRHELASASLVVSELVTNAVIHAGTDIDLGLTRLGGRLRLAVRDGSTISPRQPVLDLGRRRGRGLAITEAFSRIWGVLPTADGGKVVWAVIDCD